MYSKKETVKVLLYDLKPHPKNPKKHNDALIEKSISELGYAENIVIDENNVILAGHGRVDALKKTGGVEAGGMEIEAVRITGWTEEEKEKYLLLSNQSTILGGFDNAILKDFGNDVLVYSGFDRIIEPDEKDDEIPENAPTVAKLGDLWALGRHRLMCGDSTDKEAVSRLMGDFKADMVFTDPPYGVDYTGKTKDALKIENDRHTNSFADAMPNFIESTKAGGAFYVCCPPGNNFIDFIRPFSEYCHQSSTIIWVKNSLVMGHGDYHYKHEPILYGWNKEGKHQFYGDRSQTTVWEVNRPSRSKEHPTMKPIELMTKAIANSSKEDDIVLDLFGGSGSTLIACEKTNRICYMMELDEKYVDVIIKRWEDYTGQNAKKLT